MPVGAWSAATQASIILSEVMYDAQGADTNREWIEIYNDGASTIDLSGWQFGRPNANQWTSAFPLNTTLGANQAMVVTPSISTFDSDWGTGKRRIQVGSFPTLLNDPASASEGRIAIRNGVGAIQDEISYRYENGWPRTNGNDGASIYALPQFLSSTANDGGGAWRPSSQGLYGAYWRGAGGESENHASPGFVATQQQAPFEPSPDAAWSMVIMPDIQNYTSRNDSHLNILKGQTQWIKDHKDEFNIQVVLQEGDITNNNTQSDWWANAREGMSTLNGVVPYVVATGNHDYNTGQPGRNTQYNTYFKATDNPLVNPATGGILKGTFEPGRLENAYFAFTAPDGREMLIFSLEMWPRDNVVTWAKGVAQQPQYADSTAVLLTHAYLNSGDGYWNAGEEAYVMDGGNDGQQLWTKLVDVVGNFEMTFSGHVGGDGVGHRVDQSNAGDDVHQLLLNSQFEANGGNGWMRVLELLEDGETVKVRTYSPHFGLQRTNVANSFEFSISPLVAPETALVWNVAGSATFTDGFATGDDARNVDVFPASPWDNPYNTGKQELLVGYNGVAELSGSGSRTVGSIRVGTNQANAVIAGRNGNGTITVSNSTSLTTADTADSTGDFIIGEGGHSGVLNWNSTGTLGVQGKLRVGVDAEGVLNQNGGVVVAGNTAGSFKFVGIGINPGGDGAYHLNNGVFRPGGGIPGSEDRQIAVGDAGGIGMLNIGDGIGAPSSATVETDDDLILGRAGGAGGMTIQADGKLLMAGNGAALTLGDAADSTAIVLQTGGVVSIDHELQIGAAAGATGSYAIAGGSLTTAADNAGTMYIGRNGGDGKLRVEGTANVLHKAEAFLGNATGANANARLEISGSTASVSFGQLENAAGVSESIRWEASAAGVTPLVITGAGPLGSHRVQLQDPSEAANNSGAGVTLTGDGAALELDLSAFTASATLMLINNQTADPITGFFERGDSLDLYEEGAAIEGAGFNGAVNISYVGGTGNDVVLHLIASELNSADFDGDGDVDGSDFLTWQRGLGVSSGATPDQGDANNDGGIDGADLQLWKDQFTQPAAPTASVPEPAVLPLLICALYVGAWRNGRTKVTSRA
ncbi:MAG: lamin tail domain-containing protein [Pirellulales bacterium]|nr:lamin tail domain-containing protein [Pirellulales bacterium]